MKILKLPSPFGSYFLLQNPRPRPSTTVTEEEIAISDAALDDLSDLFNEGAGQWILGGGMSLAIHAGIYYRTHYDIDILAEVREVDSLVSSARQKGYMLCRRVISQHVSSNLTVQFLRSVDIHQAITEGYNRLELVKSASGDPSTSDLMNVIDLCVYYRGDGLITRHDGKVSLPAEEFRTHQHITKSGRAVNVASLAYMSAVKSRRHGSIDRIDLQMIRELQNRMAAKKSAVVNSWAS